MERHKERTITCKCSCHSVVWQRAGTYKDWPVLLAIWDTETGHRGSGNIKGHCMWHPNQCTSTCRDFVIYSFVTFGGTFRREEETWARNRKSLHTAQKWCNFLLEGTDFGGGVGWGGGGITWRSCLKWISPFVETLRIYSPQNGYWKVLEDAIAWLDWLD